MPPAKTGKTLTPAEIEILTRWVQEGAPYARHWAYVPPVRPRLPEIRNPKSEIRNPVDQFLLARLQKEGLSFLPEADLYDLARRAALDLTGLPPTPTEAEAFVKDPDPDAFDKYVDVLMQKGAFGEHWARIWLDPAGMTTRPGTPTDHIGPSGRSATTSARV